VTILDSSRGLPSFLVFYWMSIALFDRGRAALSTRRCVCATRHESARALYCLALIQYQSGAGLAIASVPARRAGISVCSKRLSLDPVHRRWRCISGFCFALGVIVYLRFIRTTKGFSFGLAVPTRCLVDWANTGGLGALASAPMILLSAKDWFRPVCSEPLRAIFAARRAANYAIGLAIKAPSFRGLDARPIPGVSRTVTIPVRELVFFFRVFMGRRADGRGRPSRHHDQAAWPAVLLVECDAGENPRLQPRRPLYLHVL